MARSNPRHPSVPAFTDARLESLATAVGKRAEAIKYQTQSFHCTRDCDFEGAELLELKVETLEARPTHIELSVWADGELLLNIYQSAGRGWAFTYMGDGDIGDLAPNEIVERFEETKHLVYGSSRSDDAPSQLEQLWKDARLRRTNATE